MPLRCGVTPFLGIVGQDEVSSRTRRPRRRGRPMCLPEKMWFTLLHLAPDERWGYPRDAEGIAHGVNGRDSRGTEAGFARYGGRCDGDGKHFHHESQYFSARYVQKTHFLQLIAVKCLGLRFVQSPQKSLSLRQR